MTDAEIIKALELCKQNTVCKGCPYIEKRCQVDLSSDAVDLINRKNAEIERLKSGVNVELDNYASEYDSKIKAEAVKEFAERLKTDYGELVYYGDVNKLVKEMAGDTK